MGPGHDSARIPPELCATAQAFKVFYDLRAPKPSISTSDFLETWALLGAPQTLGEFTQTEAHLHGRAFQVNLLQSHHRDGLDYIDVAAHWPSQETPPDFGGVSGGGLWRVRIFSDATGGRIACAITLEGAAFYHLGNDGEHAIVRCHGPASLQALVDESLRATGSG